MRMAVVIVNETGGDGVCRYRVQINSAAPLAHFEHNRPDGLAICLRKAAEAVEAAGVAVGYPLPTTERNG